MQFLTRVQFTTSEQQKEATAARRERDKRDIETIASFVKDSDPFREGKPLRNLVTGMVAEENVNTHLAYDNGLKIISSMENQNILEYSFKRSMQIQTLPPESCSKIKEDIEVDLQWLFQRLIAISTD
jgi:hypothetical protein